MTANLLIIEDNQIQRNTLERIFKPLVKNKEFSLTFASSVEEGKKLLKNDFFDVSIVDLLFQDETELIIDDEAELEFPGFSLIDFIYQNKIATRPLIFTGHPNERNLYKSAQYGHLIYGFMPKTMNPFALRDKVKSLLKDPLPFPKKYKSRNKSLNIKQCTVAVNQLSADRRSQLATTIANNLPLKELQSLRDRIDEIYAIAKQENRDPLNDPLDFDLERFSTQDIEIIKERYGNGCVEAHYGRKGGQKYIDKYFFKWEDELGQRHRHIFPPDHPYLLEWLATQKKN